MHRIALLSLCACACHPTRGTTEPAEPAPAPSKPAPREPAKPTPEEIQARALDATVLVTTEWSAGTGVFIDPSGFLLTNYHVVASGKNEDFGISATVTLAQRRADGSVAPGERLPAVAYAVDEKRDLALLKVDGGARRFASLQVAPEDPHPGSRVFALGNAGVGLGWAIKRCGINAIGTLDEQVSAIVQLQRDVPEAERKQLEDSIRKAAADAGRQIQTDCSILPGDSGGPLVDETTGELVGLNVAIRTAFSQFVSLGSLAFHIHAVELRDFTKTLPAAPRTFLPDPWTSAGTLGQLLDFDQDGEVDTLTFSGPCGENLTCQVALGDVDENSFRRAKELPKPDELQTSRAFDAEIAVLRSSRLPRKPTGFPMPVADILAYLDRDDDGRFDELVVQDGETGKTRGYALGGDAPARDTTLDGVAFPDLAAQYAKPALRPGVGRVIAAMTTGVSEVGNLDTVHAVTAQASDSSKDGVPDTLVVATRLDKRVLFDVDQARFAKMLALAARPGAKVRSLPQAMLLRQLRQGKLHADVMVVQSSPTRVFYDTDVDGHYDLALEGASIDGGIALGAATIDAAGRLTPAPQHIGRLLLRPALIADKARAARFEAMITTAFPGAPHANVRDDASSFPSPVPLAAAGLSSVGGFGNQVVSVFDRDSVVILVDLDNDSFKGKRAKQSALEVVQAGKFDAELTLRFSSGASWAFYDADDDGRFEHIFVAGGGDPRTVAIGYKVGKHGAVERDTERDGKRMLEPSLFKDAARQKLLTEIGKQLFP